MLTLIICAQLAAVPLAAGAQAPAEAAARTLDEGKALYEQARFTLAVATLQKAITTIEREPDVARRRTALADAFLHLGLAFLGLNEREAARDAFKNVLRLDPTFSPDAEIYAPKVIELFEQARLGLPVTAEQPSAEAVAGRVTRLRGKPRFAFVLSTTQARYADSRGEVAIPETSYHVNSVWRPGPRGTVVSGQLAVLLPNGRDRIELEGQTMDGATSTQQQPESMEFWPDDAPHYLVTGTRTASSEVGELLALEARWVRRIAENQWWTISSELSYRVMTTTVSTSLWFQETGYGGETAGESRDSELRSHGIRAGLSARRTLLKPLALEIAAGYTLHGTRDSRWQAVRSFADEGVPSFGARTPLGAVTELRGDVDLRLRAHLRLGNAAALGVGYSWRRMGKYYAGRLYQSGLTVSLTLGASR